MFANTRPVFAASALLLVSGLTAQSPYYKSIGNRWLGGAVFAAADRSTTNTPSLQAGAASLSLGADVNVLTYTLPAARLALAARNEVSYSSYYRGGSVGIPRQRASGTFRLQLAGLTVWDRSVSATGDLGGISPRTYNLFPVDPRVSVPVGPFSVTLAGNAGVTLGAGALVILPTTSIEVRVLASATTGVVARASVAVGVAGFGAGLELQGRFAETRITAGFGASLASGVFGTCGFEIQAMSVRLVAFLTALWQRVYSNTLVSWGSGWDLRELAL